MAHICSSSVSSAVINKDLNKLSELIKNGKRIDIQDNLGNTPLHIAAKKLSRGCVNILLNHPDCLIDTQNFEGCTSLFLACENKYSPVKVVKDLLDSGADPNIANNEQLYPIHVACVNGNLDLVILLHKYNANINAQDLDNYTTLHFAVDNNKKEIVEYLLKRKADTNLTECHGLNPFMLAIIRKHEEIANMMLSFTEDLNQSGNENETAITLAIKVGNLDIIKKLIERGASIDSHGPESPLVLLNLYEEDKFEIFQYIWSKINSQYISYNTDFIFLLVNMLTAKAHLPHLRIIFQTPDLKLALQKIRYIYDNIFTVGEEHPNIEYFENNKESLIIVVHGLFKQNALMSDKDMETYINFIKYCPYRLELLNIVLYETEFIINNDLIISAFLSHPSMGLLLLQHYPYYFNSSEIFHKYIAYENLEFVKYIVHFFTPTDAVLQRMLFVTNDDSVENMKQNLSGKVKSLTEIARDTTRNYIGETILGSNVHTNEFKKIIQKLDCTDCVKDILLFKKPVNIVFC